MTKQDELDGGLFEAFRSRPEGSALSAMQRLHGAIGSVLLQDVASQPEPIRIRRSEGNLDTDSRFRVLGEIARGGMGIVYQGHDLDLNRDVALKVLRSEYRDRPDVVQRFIEEAQVGGQLQHPGIVPIYALTMQGGQLCFAMKLIKGQTLSSLLESNPTKVDLKSVFEQVAQTMAYAHSRGVIHRDLKPANVMVGAFGEVQVVDWGFAKVLGREETRVEAPMQTMIATVRSADEGSNSVAGSVMGTPGYMPPEQALGQIDDLDQRADVFALGAILCEVLTGEPPYTGDAGDQLIAAAQCRLDEAFARLDACDAAPGLVRLVRSCLQARRADRPKDAGVVADQLADHFSHTAERAREARIGVAKAREEARSAAKGRRRIYALAGLMLVAVLTGGAGWAWVQNQAKARADQADREVAVTMQEATGHEGRQDWSAAVASAEQAVQKAAEEGVDGGRAAALLARLRQAAAAAAMRARTEAEDSAFLAELDAIRGRLVPEYLDEDLPGTGLPASRLSATGMPTTAPRGRLPAPMRDALRRRRAAASDAAYAAAFARRFGSLENGAERLAASHQVAAFATNLTHWARTRKNVLEAPAWQEIDQLARRLDPGHDAVHAALMADDRETLLTMARDRADDLTPPLACQVALALLDQDQPQAAADLLASQLLSAASDFWLNHRMAEVARRLGDHERQLRFATAALSVQPDCHWAWRELAQALCLVGEPVNARIAADRALSVDGDDASTHVHLGDALRCNGEVDAAVASYRRAVGLAGGDARSHYQLGLGLRASGDHAGATQAFRRATALDPTYGRAHRNLGRELFDGGDVDSAIAAYHKAHEFAPDDAAAHRGLARALAERGDEAGALASYRRVCELDPQDDGSRAALEELEQGQRLERLLAGEEVEATPRQRAALAEELYVRDHHVLALAMYAAALAADASLASDLEAGHRYSAACCAVLAGGETNLAQALAWLRADLRLRGAQVRSRSTARLPDMVVNTTATQDKRALALQMLTFWRQDSNLAAIRDVSDLAPEFTQFWADVEALIAEASK